MPATSGTSEARVACGGCNNVADKLRLSSEPAPGHPMFFVSFIWLEFLSVKRGEDELNPIKIVAIILIVAGVLGLVYGGFSYTKETHSTSLGPFELTVTDKENVNIPIWAGIGAIAIGGGLLLFGNKKS